MSTDDKPSHETLSLLSVEELLSKKGVIQRKFFIPAYQRGYRWTKSHVTRLIDDWNEFMKEAADTDFYCLQPLVTKPVDTSKFPEFAEYEEVIDGQQRLTTVLLILQAIHTLIKTKDPNEEGNIVITIVPRRYELKYETRESSDVWLNKLKSITSFDDPNAKQLIDSNCDYNHLIEVYVTAYNLLKDEEYDDLLKLRGFIQTRVKFIPYEPVITTGSNNDIFDDINAGKIGLNNAELIKALLVQESNLINHTGEGHRINTIAIEWDSVEQTLQDKEFWGFIYSSKHFTTYDTHIEYLLDLIYDKSENNIDNEYFTFDKVNAEYRKASDKLEFAEATWRKIRDMFDTLVEWYNDRKFYHRIGYLLEYGNDITITKLIAHLKGNQKDKQITVLNNLISASLQSVNAEKLFHGKHELSQILLLYNALAEDRRVGSTARFSFADYKNIKNNKTGWDQEHIASNTDATANKNERETFALDLIEFFTGERNISPSETILDMLNEKEQAFVKRLSIAGDMEQDFKPEDLTILFNDILEYFNTNNDGFNEAAPMKNSRICSEKDFIWNFALLNAGTNRSYGNALFPVKRKRILNDEFEVYTPVGTRNVFEKAYSRKLTNMMSWTRDDAKAYWEELCTVLKPYITLVFPFKNY